MTATFADYWASQVTWPEPLTLETVQGEVPKLSLAEQREMIRLLFPLMIERDGRFVRVPTDLESLRAARRAYLDSLNEQQMDAFKTSVPYMRAVAAAEKQRQDERSDRLIQQQRQHGELKEKRYRELLAAGVNPVQAAQAAEAQYGS